MKYEDITYGKAVEIITNLEKHSDVEIGTAIYKILNMPTIMAVKKDTLLKVIQYLFDMCFEFNKESEC